MTRIRLRFLSLLSLLPLLACGHASDLDFTVVDAAGTSAGGTSAGSNLGGSNVGGNAGGGPASGGSAGTVTTGGASAGATSAGGQGGSSGGEAGSSTTAGQAGQGGTAAGSAGSSADPNDIVPPSGILLGAYVDGGQLTPREDLLDRKLAIHHKFFAWTDDWIDEELKQDVAAGRVPMASWEPHTAALTDISAGHHDELVRSRARAAKKLERPILLRFGHEMNGDWYSWGGAKNGNDASGPKKYVAAWRHLHDLFSEEGASNVLWVWCPNSDGVPNAAWNEASAYYPGDAYVDWVAVDGYNWGNSASWSSWRSFKDILSPVYATYAAMGKPFMIAETGSIEGGGDKSAWFSALQADIKAFPAVKALVYFDTFDANLKLDFKIDSSPKALTAFTALSKDPYFNP